METHFLKLMSRLTLIALVAWIVATMVEKRDERRDKKRRATARLTAFPSASRAWITPLVSAPRAEAASVQPQTTLYAS